MQCSARFFVGDTVTEASAGEVAFGPAGVPHGFEKIRESRLQTIDIRHLPERSQTDLE